MARVRKPLLAKAFPFIFELEESGKANEEKIQNFKNKLGKAVEAAIAWTAGRAAEA